jgi:hypothetical protein
MEMAVQRLLNRSSHSSILFKTHLLPQVLNADKNRVLSPIVCIYQNNMLLHFQGQLNLKPPPAPAAEAPTKPHPHNCPSLDSNICVELAVLHAEVAQLKD